MIVVVCLPRGGVQYGLRKVAMKKLGDFVCAVEHYVESCPRVRLFATLMGLDRVDDYSRHVSDAFFLLLRRAFVGGVINEGGAASDKKKLERVKELLDDGVGKIIVKVQHNNIT